MFSPILGSIRQAPNSISGKSNQDKDAMDIKKRYKEKKDDARISAKGTEKPKDGNVHVTDKPSTKERNPDAQGGNIFNK